MIPILDTKDWVQHTQNQNHPSAENFLAFYNHHLQAISCDPKQMMIPIDDHLVHRGDGIFETLSIMKRHILQLDEHLHRLEQSAKGLEIPLPCSIPQLKKYIIAVSKAANTSEGSIRILIGRGPGGFGINPSECPKTSLYIVVYKTPLPTEDWYQKGLTACKSQIPAKSKKFAQLKTVGYLSGVFMALEAIHKHVDLSLSFDENNCLAEAATANIAIVDNTDTFVIPEFRHILVGTTIHKATDIIQTFMPVTTRCIHEKELPTVKELLTLNTIFGCVGITHYEGQPIHDGKTGPISHNLRIMLKKVLLSEGTTF